MLNAKAATLAAIASSSSMQKLRRCDQNQNGQIWSHQAEQLISTMKWSVTFYKHLKANHNIETSSKLTIILYRMPYIKLTSLLMKRDWSKPLPRNIKTTILLNKIPNLLQTPIKNINHHLKSHALRIMIISNSPSLITWDSKDLLSAYNHQLIPGYGERFLSIHQLADASST